MRTFSCFITGEASPTPTLSLILADSEERARELARRELLDAHRPIAVELCEGGRRIWFETIEVPAKVAKPVQARRRVLAWRRVDRSPQPSAA